MRLSNIRWYKQKYINMCNNKNILTVVPFPTIGLNTISKQSYFAIFNKQNFLIVFQTNFLDYLKCFYIN